jgi:hypothetical protein
MNKLPQNPQSCQTDVMRSAFFSVHSVKALENRQFSIVHANIENTPDKVELARSLYPIEDWHFEFHNYKIDMRPVRS